MTACPYCNRPNTVAPGCVTCGNSYCQEANYCTNILRHARGVTIKRMARERLARAEAAIERTAIALGRRPAAACPRCGKWTNCGGMSHASPQCSCHGGVSP